MNMRAALHHLGVTDETLTSGEKRALARDGFLILPALLDRARIDAMAARLTELAAAEGDQAGREVYQEPGTLRISDLVNKGPSFHICFRHPRLLACVRELLGDDFKVSSVDCRFALPGAGEQRLHQDWLDLARRRSQTPHVGPPVACSALWLLDDFTPDNGATRVVPGSHRLDRRPDEAMVDRFAPHPLQQLILAPAGSVVVYDSLLWHGGTRNRTALPRRIAASSFVRRSRPQLTDQRKRLRPETLPHLDRASCVLLDVDPWPDPGPGEAQ